MKITLSEIKKNFQGTNSGVDEAENQINELECKEEKNIWMAGVGGMMGRKWRQLYLINNKINIQSEEQKEKRIQKNMDRLRSLWDNFKCTNI